jgi:hypothetical protein
LNYEEKRPKSSPASSRHSAETLIGIKWELGRAAGRDFVTPILSGRSMSALGQKQTSSLVEAPKADIG